MAAGTLWIRQQRQGRKRPCVMGGLPLLTLLLWMLAWPCAVPVMAADAPANAGEFFRAVERGGIRPNGGRDRTPPPRGADRPLPLGDPSGLPGTEITPQDMVKAFPEPLPRTAPLMDLLPQPAPLMPLSPAPDVAAPRRPAPDIPAPPSLSQPQGKGLQAPAPARPQTPPPSRQGVAARSASGAATPAAGDAAAPVKAGNDAGALPAPPSLEAMAGQMLLVGFAGTELKNNAPILDLARRGMVGGVVLLEGDAAGPRNIESPPQVRVLTATLQKAAREGQGIPLFLAVEQEGGTAQALPPAKGFDGGPAAARLGQGSPEATGTAARRMGLEMAALGLNMNLAPVADVNLNPLSEEIGGRFRAFSPDPQRVAAHVLAFGKGLAAANIIPCLKYFPGTGNIMNGMGPGAAGLSSPAFPAFPASAAFSSGGPGAAASRAPTNLPDMGGTWREAELVPYATALRQGWPGAVMPALAYHRGLDALYPATLSPRMLTDILRRRLGFDGVIISNDLEALALWHPLEDAILLAVQAGADILFLPGRGGVSPERAATAHAMLVRLAREGRISTERLRQSWQRIMDLKKRYLYDNAKALQTP